MPSEKMVSTFSMRPSYVMFSGGCCLKAGMGGFGRCRCRLYTHTQHNTQMYIILHYYSYMYLVGDAHDGGAHGRSHRLGHLAVQVHVLQLLRDMRS